MVNKKMLLLLVGLFLLPSFGTVYAEEQRVFDDADLFLDKNEGTLQAEINTLQDEVSMDIVIVTTDDTNGKPSATYADEFYLSHDFGYGGTEDAIIYLINMDEREVYIYLSGDSNDYFSKERIERALDAVYVHLAEEMYFESAMEFLSEVDRVINEEGKVIHTDESQNTASPRKDEDIWVKLIYYFVASIIAGGGVIGGMVAFNRGRSTVNERTYLEEGSFVVTNRKDRYYTTRVTRRNIQRNNNSRGGGGFSGGGGRRVGGGGRKF